MQTSKALAIEMIHMQNNGTAIEMPDVYEEIYQQALAPMDNAAQYLFDVIFVSYIQLFFPLNMIMDRFFTYATKRKPAEIGINFLNEACLFIVIILLLIDEDRFIGHYDPMILFAREDMTDNQLFTCNVLQHQIKSTYPFEYLLAILAGNTWLKLLLKLRVTKLFGPMFKTLQNMTIDLVQFMIIWGIVLIMFSCISSLIFGQLDAFQDFGSILVLYFETSLGNWNLNYYKGFDTEGNQLTTIYHIGMVYNCLFLLVNMVLFLNFVIAILSSTFAYYENKQLGLYYEVIIALFPSMEYDEKYGAVVCAQPPFNLMILPFWWVTVFPLNDSFLRSYNTFLCHLLYLPVGLVITTCFTLGNLILMPLAYFKHILSLINTLTDSDETMDELSEKIRRVLTIIYFIVLGPIILTLSIPINFIVFFCNLYTKPLDADKQPNIKMLSKMSIQVLTACCNECLAEHRRVTGKQRTTHVNFVTLNKLLQKKLDIQKRVRDLVFNNFDDSKFVYDKNTNMTKLHPKYLDGIKEFNNLKKLVANCADKTGMVDTELIKSLIDQVNLRCEMLDIEIKADDLELGMTEEEIYQAALFELAKTEPKSIEGVLADEGQVLQTLDEKLNNISSNMSTF